MSDYSIHTDRRTVWVNRVTGCVARFGKEGATVMSKTSPYRWVFIAPSPPSPDDWGAFVRAAEDAHGVRLGDELMPDWIRTAIDPSLAPAESFGYMRRSGLDNVHGDAWEAPDGRIVRVRRGTRLMISVDPRKIRHR